MSEHHDVVKLLLARMESHPDEFEGIANVDNPPRLYTSRWGTILNKYWHVLTKEEQAAINDKLHILGRHHFHIEVMRELLDPKESRTMGEQLELFPAQSAYPPGGKPLDALKIIEDEMERNLQRQRGR